MKKPLFLLLVCICGGGAFLPAQQITRFAVIDTSRIYTTFLRDSRSVRDYQAKQEKYQAETQRMSDEIIALRQKKVDAEAAGKTDAAKKYQVEISYEAKKLQKHLQNADNKNAKIFLCVGENEMKENKIWYKNLETKDEKTINLDELEKELG